MGRAHAARGAGGPTGAVVKCASRTTRKAQKKGGAGTLHVCYCCVLCVCWLLAVCVAGSSIGTTVDSSELLEPRSIHPLRVPSYPYEARVHQFLNTCFTRPHQRFANGIFDASAHGRNGFGMGATPSMGSPVSGWSNSMLQAWRPRRWRSDRWPP